MASEKELEEFLRTIREHDVKECKNNEKCPIKYTLGVIGGKWKLRILAHLLKKDVVRFNELKKEISGITNTMLSNSLHELEEDKLVIRNQYNEMPLRVEYELTEKGKSLLPLLYELSSWGKNQIDGSI